MEEQYTTTTTVEEDMMMELGHQSFGSLSKFSLISAPDFTTSSSAMSCAGESIAASCSSTMQGGAACPETTPSSGGDTIHSTTTTTTKEESRSPAPSPTPGPNELRDIDFPSGRRYSVEHPKRVQLVNLIRKAAPEYHIAPGCEGFESTEHGRFIRSKAEIITNVIDALLKEGGRYMVMNKEGSWVVNTDYHADSQKMRKVISAAFKAEIKSWNGVVPPLPPVVNEEETEEVAEEETTVAPKEDEEEEFKCCTSPPKERASSFKANINSRAATTSFQQADQRLKGFPVEEEEKTAFAEVDVKRSRSLDRKVLKSRPSFTAKEQRDTNNNNNSEDYYLNYEMELATIDGDDDKRSRSSTIPSQQPPPQRRRLLTGAVDRARAVLQPRNNKKGQLDSFMARIDDVLGSISLAEPSTISSLSRAASKSQHSKSVKRKASQTVLRVLKLVPSTTTTTTQEEEKKHEATSPVTTSDGVNIVDMEITMEERQAEASTLGSGCGYGHFGGKSVKRLVADLRKRSLGEVAIKQRLDELIHRAISEDKALKSEETVEEVVEVVSKVMEAKVDDVDVQLKAFSLISQLYDNIGNIIASTNAPIAQVMRAMRRHTKRAAVQRMACRLLGHLARQEHENRVMIIDANGIDMIVDAMLRHFSHEGIQRWGCFALRQLSDPSLSYSSATANKDGKYGIDVILQTMLQHGQHAKVQEWGCHALGQLAIENSKNQRLIAEANNGIAVIMEAMRNHKQHTGVQMWGCFGLGRLAFGMAKNQRMVAEANNAFVSRATA